MPLATHSLLFRDLARVFLTLLVVLFVATALVTGSRSDHPPARPAIRAPDRP